MDLKSSERKFPGCSLIWENISFGEMFGIMGRVCPQFVVFENLLLLVNNTYTKLLQCQWIFKLRDVFGRFRFLLTTF